MYEQFGDGEEEGKSSDDPRKHFRRFMGPQMIDQQIRSALQQCWMSLPEAKQNAAELESQIRRIVNRALQDFRDDMDAFEY